jgi:hypothetical protein
VFFFNDFFRVKEIIKAVRASYPIVELQAYHYHIKRKAAVAIEGLQQPILLNCIDDFSKNDLACA